MPVPAGAGTRTRQGTAEEPLSKVPKAAQAVGAIFGVKKEFGLGSLAP